MSSRWSTHVMREAMELWRAGATVFEISTHFGCSHATIEKVISNNRNLFPYRSTRVERTEPEPVKTYADRVTRAGVTLPRVTFIDGPYMEAAE